MKKITLFLILFAVSSSWVAAQEILLLKTSGKVIIGDTTQISTPGNYNLYVQNGILTERVKVSLKNSADWSDDAWESTPSLAAVAQSIVDKAHLVGMPSAQSIVETGYDVTAMDAKLLEQIEWLWQHMIELDKENKRLSAELEALKQK